MALRVAALITAALLTGASGLEVNALKPGQKKHSDAQDHKSQTVSDVEAVQQSQPFKGIVAQMPITSEALVHSEAFIQMKEFYMGQLSMSLTVSADSSSLFFMKAGGLVFCIFCVIFAYSLKHEEVEEMTGLKLAHICCLTYAILSISIDLSIKNAAEAYGGHFPFHPACGVIVVEYAKCTVSLVLFALYVRKANAEGTEIAWPRKSDVGWLAVPAAIYAMNNLIVFKAIQSCPLSTFGVIRETMLVWNALIWCATFQQSISASRWLAIGGIFLGCSINQIPKMLNDDVSPGICWALLLAFCNAAGAVANEYAMKQRAAIDINLQNVILYTLCGSFVLIGLTISEPSHVQSASAFFHGFVPECWQVIILQVFTGLAVSRILKYVEAVTKTIVAAIRGPGVIFFGALIFKTSLGVSEILATLVVCASCWHYLRQGPLVKPPEPKAEPNETTPLQSKDDNSAEAKA